MTVPRIAYRAFRSMPLLLLFPSAAALAHAFVQPYSLPVPFAMYSFGAGAALVLSFVIVGMFATAPSLVLVRTAESVAPVVVKEDGWPRVACGGLSLGLLLLCIATGLVGTQNAFANFNMTFFWIVFVLGIPYLTALIGDFYGEINPWRMLVRCIGGFGGVSFEGRLRYPEGVGYWPAFAMYMAFIWLELFGELRPYGLSLTLLAYSVINVIGAWLVGERAWFRHGEFFDVLMRLIGAISPWPLFGNRETQKAFGRSRWRVPFSGLRRTRAEHISLVLFILFMLSSTAFDGLHSTLPWVSVFWKQIYPTIAPWFPTAPAHQYALSAQLYYAWQWISLLLSPAVYLVVFVAFVWLARIVTRSRVPVGELVLRFSVSWIPIAFVYHVTHYYTLVLAQGAQIVRLASDPFGFGWNVFGTAKMTIDPVMVSMDGIWHTQVALILAGHIASVYLAHVEALQVFETSGRAALSQLPMLAVMVLFTVVGLWILSLPIVGS